MEPLAANDPRRVGEFQMRARLGVGGMGRVYLGFSPAGRAVAVKVVHPELARDQQFIGRFRQEVAAARAVSGIYTAPVVTAGLDDDPPWLATVFVPGQPLSTHVARGLLPDRVPHADAAFTAGRAGLLATALTVPGMDAERRRELLFAGTEDRLHQDYRASAMPASAELLARLRADGHPACVSGAGPSVLAFGVAGAAQLKSSEYARSGNPVEGGDGWRASMLAVASVGVVVEDDRAPRNG